MALSDEEFDQVFLDKWSLAKSKDRSKGFIFTKCYITGPWLYS
jgi:hypothetical protein